LKEFNRIGSEVLYPPIASPERFHNEGYGDELLFICRIEDHKRQHLALEAMKYTKTPVRMRICGATRNPHYVTSLMQTIRNAGLPERVTLDNRWIGEDEKVELLAHCLANIYLPVDEDSYGYPTLEAAHSSKATITVQDAGGVGEFVVDGHSGSVVPCDPQALGETFDKYWSDRHFARRVGAGARARIDELGITWDRVVTALTSTINSRT
jgi:glycosyltransferase involved in cell wall biosynthesis